MKKPDAHDVGTGERACSDVILARLGQFTHLRKDGSGYRAKKCPLCGNENYALGVDFNPVQAHCFACDGRTKDVLEVLGLDPRNFRPLTHWTPPARVESTPDEAQRVRLEQLWSEAFLLDSRNIGGLYLASRGLSLERYPQNVRVHGQLDYWDGSTAVGVYPALLARVETKAGELVALHRTYLSPSGSSKAKVESPKKLSKPVFSGATKGAAIHLYPVRDGKLALCEGLETGLGVRQATGWAVWACVSAGGLEAVDLPSNATEVVVCTDHDARGLKAARTLVKRALESGLIVRLAVPPLEGQDWLDVLNSERGTVVL